MAQFTVKVPFHRFYDLDELRPTFQPIDGTNIVFYTGDVNSPLNGGRQNGYVDDLVQDYSTELFKGIPCLASEPYEDSIANRRERLIAAIKIANVQGYPVHLTMTNLFFEPEVVESNHFEVLTEMVLSSEDTGIRNGVIIANPVIEILVRNIGGSSIDYIKSCTAFVRPASRLRQWERINAYNGAVHEYDSIVITPQDAKKPQILKNIDPEFRDLMNIIVTSFCSDQCNSYHHYAQTSSFNILTRLDMESPLTDKYLEIAETSNSELPFRHCNGNHPNIYKTTRDAIGLGFRRFKVARIEVGVENLMGVYQQQYSEIKRAISDFLKQ